MSKTVIWPYQFLSYKLRRLLLVTIDNIFMHVCILLKSVYLHTGTQGDVYLVIDICGCVILCVGADLEISSNDSGEVNGIFLQDSDMKLFFDKYPELVLVDATYKLTNVHMALYVMLCIGPNGESEIVALFLSTLEDTQSLRSALKQFKERNSKWTEIKTVMTDKDMAERDAIRQEFSDASLLLCVFHVLRSMSREITTTKMGINEAQRASALKVMQSLVYASTVSV